jgi:hypothetical protein
VATLQNEEEGEDGPCEEHVTCISGRESDVLRTIADELKLGVAERRALGQMAKEIVDCGRAAYLEAHGYQAWLERGFVPAAVTPENRLLRARALALSYS